MRVVVTVMPFAGHLASVLPVVAALVRAGHEVRVYTGSAYRNEVRARGATWLGWEQAPDFEENNLSATFPVLAGRKGPRQLMANLEHIFIRTGAGQFRDLMTAWSDGPWDVLLADTLSTGAVLVAESTGCRWASLSVIPLALPGSGVPPPGLALRPARGPAGRIRDALLNGAYSLLTLPLHTAYNQTRHDAGLPPSWWDEVLADPRPLVHVTQGTQNVDPSDVILPALAALAPLDVHVVAVTGRAGHRDVGVELPGNAHVTDLIPYEVLLPHVSLMVTNGGWGGALAALSHGIPLIVAGGDIDKPEIAARVAYSGAGINLRTGTPSRAHIAAAVATIRTDPLFAARAADIATQLNALAAPEEITRLLEDLADPWT